MSELYPAHEQAAVEILGMAPGEVYPFRRFAELCRESLESDAVRFCRLRTLAVLRERGVNLRAIRGVGYERIPESDRVRRQVPLALAKAKRALAAAAQDMRTIDVTQLESGDVRRLAEQQSRLGAVTAFVKLRAPQKYRAAKLPEVPKLGG